MSEPFKMPTCFDCKKAVDQIEIYAGETDNGHQLICYWFRCHKEGHFSMWNASECDDPMAAVSGFEVRFANPPLP